MSFRVSILGSNSALPAYGRNHSAQLIQIEDMHFLMDCGEGTQLQLTKRKGKFQKITHIFISHLHGDHFLGLMGLLYSMNLNKRTTPLHLYSHRGLDDIITTQLRHSQTYLNYDVVFHVLEESRKIFENEKVEITNFPLNHRILCSGFRFQEKKKPLRIDKEKLPDDIKLQYIALIKQGEDVFDEYGNILYDHRDYTLPPKRSRSYAYCSDTAFDESIVPFIKNVDLLYHESTFLNKHQERADNTYHSTAEQAAKIAKAAGVKQLLLGHYSARYRDITPFADEAKLIFKNSRLAIEGETIEISDL